MPNRRQAFIWSNTEHIHWRIYAALGEDELRPLVVDWECFTFHCFAAPPATSLKKCCASNYPAFLGIRTEYYPTCSRRLFHTHGKQVHSSWFDIDTALSQNSMKLNIKNNEDLLTWYDQFHHIPPRKKVLMVSIFLLKNLSRCWNLARWYCISCDTHVYHKWTIVGTNTLPSQCRHNFIDLKNYSCRCCRVKCCIFHETSPKHIEWPISAILTRGKWAKWCICHQNGQPCTGWCKAAV